MRTCFFVATKTGTAGAILTAAPNLFKVQAQDDQGNPVGKPRLVYTPGGDHTRAVEMLLHRVRGGVSFAGDTWTVWLLIPLSLDWRHGPRALRKFVRARLGSDVLGPFCLPEIARRSQALADLLCYRPGLIPHVITGDDRAAISAVDYAPTQEEADADTEPNPEDLFGGEG